MLADLIVSLSRGSPPSHNAQWQSVAARNEGVFNIFPKASIAHDIFHLTELDQDHLSELLMEKEAGIFHQKESRLNLSAGKNGDKKGSRIGLNWSQNSFFVVRKQN